MSETESNEPLQPFSGEKGTSDHTVVTNATTNIGEQLEGVLDMESIADSADKKLLLDAYTFLQSDGKKDLEDIRKHALNVAAVIEGYDMSGEDAPTMVSTIYAQLEKLQRRYHILNAQEELKKPEPDLLHLLYCIRMSSSNSSAITSDIGNDISQLKEEIIARGLQSDAYDRMKELAAAIEDALPFLADRNDLMRGGSIISALISGDTSNDNVYVRTALEKFAPKLRADAEVSDTELHDTLLALSVKITELARKMLPAVH